MCSPPSLCHHLYATFQIVAWVSFCVLKHLWASHHIFPASRHGVTPLEDCLIYALAPLFAYLQIWDSLFRQNVGSLIRWSSSMRFHFDSMRFHFPKFTKKVPVPIQFSFAVFDFSWWLLPKYPCQVLPPSLTFHLWLLRKYSIRSSISVSRSHSKYATNSG